MSAEAEFREARAKLEQYRQIIETLRAVVESNDPERIAWTAKKVVKQADEVENG